MGRLKNELSEKSKYHLSKHRYLELKHFCLQYPEWKEQLKAITELSAIDIGRLGSGQISNETERIAFERLKLQNRINLVERTAMETDKSLWFYILTGVTEERSYEYLRQVMGMPCGRNVYYERYRAFYWLMDRGQELHAFK